jgi:hypothetical protein
MQEILLKGKLIFIVFDIPLITGGRERENASPGNDYKEHQKYVKIFKPLKMVHWYKKRQLADLFSTNIKGINISLKLKEIYLESIQ